MKTPWAQVEEGEEVDEVWASCLPDLYLCYEKRNLLTRYWNDESQTSLRIKEREVIRKVKSITQQTTKLATRLE